MVNNFESKIKRELEEMIYQENLLGAIFVSSISKESSQFPKDKRAILYSLVNGTIEHHGGNAGKIYYGEKSPLYWFSFEKELYEYLVKETSHSKKEFDSRVKDTVIKLCKPTRVSGFMGIEEAYLNTKLYSHLEDGIIKGGLRSPPDWRQPHSLYPEFVTRVKKEILPGFSNPERKEIVGIGKAMRPYLDEFL